MFQHVFPPGARASRARGACSAPSSQVQKDLEDVLRGAAAAGQVLLCDRGTPDGGGYWPDGHEAFFRCDADELGGRARTLRRRAVSGDRGRGRALDRGGQRGADGGSRRRRSRSIAAYATCGRATRASAHVALEQEFAVKVARGVEALRGCSRSPPSPPGRGSARGSPAPTQQRTTRANSAQNHPPYPSPTPPMPQSLLTARTQESMTAAQRALATDLERGANDRRSCR